MLTYKNVKRDAIIHINSTTRLNKKQTNKNKTEDVVECKMDLSKGVGSLACRMCSASYQMPIHHLHEPIDVFSEWLDDCEAAERGEIAAASSASASATTTNMSRVVHDTSQNYDDDDSDDDELPEASGLGQKKSAAPAAGGGAKKSDNDGGGGGEKSKTTTAALGLDDSDSDSD